MNMKIKNQTLIIFEAYFDSTERSEGEGDQKLTNQFSYVERATQTMNNTLKVIIIILVAMLMSRVLYSVIVSVIVVACPGRPPKRNVPKVLSKV